MDALPGSLGVEPIRGGKRGENLDEPGLRRGTKPKVGQDLRGACQEESADLRLGQTRELRPKVVRQYPTATVTALSVHGNPGGGKRLHVAMNGALGYLEPRGQLPCGHAATGLEKEENGEQAISAHRFRL